MAIDLTDGECNMKNDSISRQAAIDAVMNTEPVFDTKLEPYQKTKDVISALEELPTAELKTGEWIIATGMMPPEFHGHHCCSECGNFANMEPPFGNREDLSKFCPNCGADMRERKES